MPFEIDRRDDQRACILRVEGDIDIAVVPDIRQALDQSIETGCENIVIDLAGVAYADSSALGMLVWLDHRLQPFDGKAVLAGANDDVARILEMSGLLSVSGSLDACEDVEGAMSRFSPVEDAIEVQWAESVDVPSDVRQLAAVREQVYAMVRSMGFTESALFDIKVALGEALANAVRHGSPTDGEGGIHVDVTAYPDRLVLEVIDAGSGFDGDLVCNDDLYAIGGRGVMFMRALMDHVCFSAAADGGTKVVLVKHRPTKSL